MPKNQNTVGAGAITHSHGGLNSAITYLIDQSFGSATLMRGKSPTCR